MNAREAAFIALLSSQKQERFISLSLDEWDRKFKPSSQDFHLAQEISYGTARMALALDYLAEQLASNKKLNLKMKSRLLLRTAIYQYYFMHRIPHYALTDETLKISKKYCHPSFTAFLNALLRKSEHAQLTLPLPETASKMSIRYSYPLFLVMELIRDYGFAKAQEIMEAQNRPSIAMARIRKSQAKGSKSLHQIEGIPAGIILDHLQLNKIALNPDFYIQNATPIALMQKLHCLQDSPARILDLCASPGGKSIYAQDLYPHAKLYANDISETKLKKLKENFEKYQIKASLSCSKGEDFKPESKFDIIILDVPCSNSGVLNKRPEARWRITEEVLKSVTEKQLSLVKKASQWLAPKGQIWYMTCSILKKENEDIVNVSSAQLKMHSLMMETILPNKQGWDGGFAACLEKI